MGGGGHPQKCGARLDYPLIVASPFSVGMPSTWGSTLHSNSFLK